MSERKADKDKIKETPTKNNQSEETVNCASCSVIYAKKDVPKHRLWCLRSSIDQDRKSTTVSSIKSIPTKAAHGFVYDRRHLFAQVVSDFAAPKEFQALQFSRLRERVIFLNPKSMRECNLKIGDHVMVSTVVDGSEESTTAVVWPSSKVPIFHVGIPMAARGHEFRIFENRFCGISNISTLRTTSRLRLIPDTAKSFYGNQDFGRICQMYLSGTCLKSSDDVIRIPHYGQICVMKAIPTVGDYTTIAVSADRSTFSLADQLSALELTENYDLEAGDINGSYSSTSTSTPLQTPLLENGVAGLSPGTPGKPACIKLPSFNTDACFVLVDNSTNVIIDLENTAAGYRPSITFADLGGMARAKEILIDHVSICLRENAINGTTMKTILLYGMAGCGKTSLAEAVASEVGANFFRLDSSVIGNEDESAATTMGFTDLDGLLRAAEKHSPSVILIDDVEAISEKAKKSFGHLTSWIEKVAKSRVRICAIGATSSIERLNGGLRKRFQFEIEIPVPTAADRKLILRAMLSNSDGISESEIEILADRTHGFTPLDLSILLKEAVVVAHKRLKFVDHIELALADFLAALISVRPSAMREIFVEVPKVRWSDVGGNDEVKLKLQQAVEWPLQHTEKFARLGIKPPTGILMYGPPGCSKTMIAKALATESGLNFLSVKGPELFSKWVGESERAVRDLFRKARQVAPSVIFFDEIDAVGSERGSAGGSSSNVNERVLAQMLTEMDGIQPLSNVTIVAATNRPDIIDRALLRPGRLDISVYVRLPDEQTRKQILELEFKKKKHISDDVDVSILVEKTDGYTGAELVALCNEAGLAALSECWNIETISVKHFDKALMVIKPRVSKESLKVYERFEKSVAM